MLEYKEMGERVRLIFEVPSRLLLGVRSALRNDTHGAHLCAAPVCLRRRLTVAAVEMNTVNVNKSSACERDLYALVPIKALRVKFVLMGRCALICSSTDRRQRGGQCHVQVL